MDGVFLMCVCEEVEVPEYHKHDLFVKKLC